MAASAGTVTLNLDANSVKLMRELQKTERQTRRTASSMAADFRNSFANIAKRAAQMSAIMAAATATVVRSQMQNLDALGKTSDALGVQQERLQALHRIAQLTGVGVEGLNTNLQRMQRRIGEIARNGGPAEKALTDIGVSLRDIVDLPADRQLEEISKGLAGVENAAIKASIANNIFGRDGARMLALMKDLNTNGLDPAVERLKQMGLALSRVDTAVIERANDNMTDMSLIIQGLFQRVTVPASEALLVISNRFIDMANDATDMGDRVDQAFHQFMVSGIRAGVATANAVSAIKPIIDSIWNGYRSLPPFAQEVGIVGAIVMGKRGIAAFAGIAFLLDQTQQYNKRIQAQLDEILGTTSVIQDNASDGFSLFNLLPDGLQLDADKAIEQYTREVVRIRAEIAKSLENRPTGQLIEFDDPDDQVGLDKAAEFVRQLRTRYSTELELLQMKHIQEEALLNEALLKYQVHTEEWAQLHKNLMAEQAADLERLATQNDVVAQRMEDLYRAAAQNIQGAFATFFFDPFEGGVKGMLRSFIDAVRQMMAQVMALALVKQMAGMDGPIGKFMSMALPSRDSGGRGVPGQPYMIGKGAQPEIFIPDSAGTFIPNADKLGGGPPVTIIVHAEDPGAEARIKTIVMQELAPQIMAATRGSTIAALKRPRFA